MKHSSVVLASAAALALIAGSVSAQGPARLTPRPTSPAITAADAMTRVYVLADDSMMGRESGTRGNVMGTDYIASEARRMGLQPAGDNGTFFQTIPMVKKGLDAAAALSAGEQALTLFTDFLPLPRVGPLNVGETFQAAGVPVVYGGQWGSPEAISVEQARGKFVVFAPAARQPAWQVWAFGPMDRYAGAAGVAIATLDGTPPPLVEYIRTPQEGMHAEPVATTQTPVMLVTRAAAERLLGAAMDGMAVGTTGRTATGAYRFAETPVAYPARNVVAMLPGTDARLSRQYVAVGAHNDHVGMGAAVDHDSVRIAHRLFRRLGADQPEPRLTPAQSRQVQAGRDSVRRTRAVRMDSVFNGADDDASGSTGVLEIAEYFARPANRPRRSLLFVWHTAEEKGLFGSEYFTDHPTVPRDSIVAQLNIDMIGRGGADDQTGVSKSDSALFGGPGYVQLVGSRRLSTQLGDMVEEVNRAAGHRLRLDYSLDADGHATNIYCRSDHYNYARYGIPVTFFTTGLHADYHQVTDEAQYIDFERIASVSRLVADIATAVANRDAPPALSAPKPDPHGECRQ